MCKIDRGQRDWLRMVIIATVLAFAGLGSSVLGQEGEAQGPTIGVISIEAVDLETGQPPANDADKIDFKVAWELCAPVDNGDEIQWSAREFQAYYSKTPVFFSEPGATENLVLAGTDSSGYMDEQEFVFRNKESDQQSYFLIKGILRGDGTNDSIIVFSPVSMDVFPRPVILITLWQRIGEWIAEKGWRTTAIVLFIGALFIIGLYWWKGCRQKLSNEALFVARGLGAGDIVKDILKENPNVSDPDRTLITDALGASLGSIAEFLPSKKGAQLKDLPAYRIYRSAVAVFLSSNSTPAEIQTTLESQVNIELKELRNDSKVDWIWNFGYVEPLVGLLGTVTGLAFAFASKVDNINSDMFAGIYEALYTTIAGLTTGIALVLIYNICDHRFRRVEGAFQRIAADLATHLRR